MFIRVASRLTIFTEEGIILGVRDYINSQSTVEFKPLRPFPPVLELNMRKHTSAVAATPVTGRVII